MDGPDNITVTPRGGLITCEDDPSSAYVDTTRSRGIEHINRLIGLTRRERRSSWRSTCSTGRSWRAPASARAVGRCFNIFGRARFDEDPVEGMTCAVTGPWHRGPL